MGRLYSLDCSLSHCLSYRTSLICLVESCSRAPTVYLRNTPHLALKEKEGSPPSHGVWYLNTQLYPLQITRWSVSLWLNSKPTRHVQEIKKNNNNVSTFIFRCFVGTDSTSVIPVLGTNRNLHGLFSPEVHLIVRIQHVLGKQSIRKSYKMLLVN